MTPPAAEWVNLAQTCALLSDMEREVWECMVRAESCSYLHKEISASNRSTQRDLLTDQELQHCTAGVALLTQHRCRCSLPPPCCVFQGCHRCTAVHSQHVFHSPLLAADFL